MNYKNDEYKSSTEPDWSSGTSSTNEYGGESSYDGSVCKNCGRSPVVEGYAIPLCRSCRERFIKYPIPPIIKVFSVILLAILVFSLISFPKSLKAGIAYERALRAERDNKYITAAAEYQKVVDIFPNSFIACGKLFVSHVKNYNFEEAENVFSMIEGEESSDSEETGIIDQANTALGFMEDYYSYEEALINIAEQSQNESLESTADKLETYIVQSPDDHWAHYLYGNVLFDLKKYELSKAEYLKAVELKPEFHEFRLGVAAAYRQTGEFDKAIEECNKVLVENAEFPDAIVSLSKIDLKCYRYEDALDKAMTAFEYDSTNTNVIATLAIAYHYNDMTSERDELLNTLKDYDADYYEFVKDVIDGKTDLYN